MTKTLLNEWNVDAEELESAIRLIRTLDPAGVCAYDMRDCFKLQLERRGVTDRIPYEIIDDYLKEVAERKFSGISRRMKISTARVRTKTRGTPSRPPSSQFHRVLYRFTIAPNLQLASHAPHFMHFLLSITKGLRTCPLMAPAGQLRAHRLHPRHFSGSMA